MSIYVWLGYTMPKHMYPNFPFWDLYFQTLILGYELRLSTFHLWRRLSSRSLFSLSLPSLSSSISLFSFSLVPHFYPPSRYSEFLNIACFYSWCIFYNSFLRELQSTGRLSDWWYLGLTLLAKSKVYRPRFLQSFSGWQRWVEKKRQISFFRLSLLPIPTSHKSPTRWAPSPWTVNKDFWLNFCALKEGNSQHLQLSLKRQWSVSNHKFMDILPIISYV